jgi:cytochrome c oxidase subunit 2
MPTSFSLLPPNASSVATEMDLLYAFITAVSAFFVVLVAALVVIFAIKFHRRHPDEVGADIHGSLALELTWTFIPFVLAMAMFVWGADLFFRLARPPLDSMEVFVVGKQWMWKVQHPEGVREINELHVPINRNVRLTMGSEDVLHDFSIPAFRVKMDVVPGRMTTLWFRATRVGEYHLFCAEFCGTKHSGMIGRVVVMTPEDYQAWLSGGASAETPAQAGERLFTQYGCATCHQGGSGARGPALAGVPGSTVELTGGRRVVADDNYLRESIMVPAAKIVAGYQPIMPTFQGTLGEEQVLQLIAYIKSLGPAGTATGAAPPAAAPPAAPAPQAQAGSASAPAGRTGGAPANAVQAGEQLFTQVLGCSACHLPTQSVLGPVLRGVPGSMVELADGKRVLADDAYLRESILNPMAKVVRGFQPVMPPFQGRVNDEQLRQLIAYLKSLAPAGAAH